MKNKKKNMQAFNFLFNSVLNALKSVFDIGFVRES